MRRLLIITPEKEQVVSLGESLERHGFVCSIISYNNALEESFTRQLPDLLLVIMDNSPPDSGIWGHIQRLKQKRHLPVIALVSVTTLNNIESQLNVDDFITSPYDDRELILRINRLIHKTRGEDSNELIKCDGLVIDIARCEVTVEGRVVELTFKEYELLKLLARNRGRVYTREDLLNIIWGYDYYGGDRTVDVHVRRLRSKIEVSKYTFIETVRNIGYKFKKEL